MLGEHPAPHTRIAAPSKHAARQDLLAEEFSRLYEHERLSLDQISKLTGFSRGTLTALAAEYCVALRPAGGKPRHQMVDRDWLFEQYVLHTRPLPDLAREKGMSNANMRRWAQIHQIPMRPSGGASHNAALRTTEMAADAPDILKPLLTSTYARQRLSRFAKSVEYRSIREAARHLGIHESTLSHQIQLLEQALGGPLLERSERRNPHETHRTRDDNRSRSPRVLPQRVTGRQLCGRKVTR